jgi:hypothetical protein
MATLSAVASLPAVASLLFGSLAALIGTMLAAVLLLVLLARLLLATTAVLLTATVLLAALRIVLMLLVALPLLVRHRTSSTYLRVAILSAATATPRICFGSIRFGSGSRDARRLSIH